MEENSLVSLACSCARHALAGTFLSPYHFFRHDACQNQHPRSSLLNPSYRFLSAGVLAVLVVSALNYCSFQRRLLLVDTLLRYGDRLPQIPDVEKLTTDFESSIGMLNSHLETRWIGVCAPSMSSREKYSQFFHTSDVVPLCVFYASLLSPGVDPNWHAFCVK